MYPALAVLHAINRKGWIDREHGIDDEQNSESREDLSHLEILWIGSVGGMEEELVRRERIPFESVPSAGVHGVGIKALPGNLVKLQRGYGKARKILVDYRPDVLFFTGGYVAVPVALAGRKIPSLLFVPDIEPGLALKTIARFADKIAVSVEDSVKYFPRHDVKVTGYPVRSNITKWTKQESKEFFGLEDDLPVLLVFGGSKGAHSINEALWDNLFTLLPDMQIIHISGMHDWDKIQRKIAKENKKDDLLYRYHAYPYLHDEMGAAFAVADLVLSRAGASCLGEFPLFGLPAILVPYPYAWRYQQLNAEYLKDKGAAEIIDDASLNQKMVPVVKNILKDNNRLMKMRAAMKRLAKPEASSEIAKELYSLASPLVGKG